MLEVRRTGEERIGEVLEALYINHLGLLEKSEVSQMARIVCSLADVGVQMKVLSFETESHGNASSAWHLLAAHDVEWVVRVRRRGPRILARGIDLMLGIALAQRLARTKQPHLVHGAGYLGGLIAWTVKFLHDAHFVFDMRGFWPEERVELGRLRPHGFLYRLGKLCERGLLAASDHIIVPTHSAKAILRDREAGARMAARCAVPEKPITVVPYYADLERFKPCSPDLALQQQHDLEGKLVIGNIGAANRRYMLQEMFRFAFHVKSHRPDTRFVYLTEGDETRLRADARHAGLSDEDLTVLSVDPGDVPRWLSLFRCGIFFLRPSYAAKASTFAELAEFLACGVPVVTNTGVGDVDKILGARQCGVLVPGLTEGDLKAAARQALPLLEGDRVSPEVRAQCRTTAEKHFALEEGARRFLSIYRRLAFPEDERHRESVAVEVG